MNNKLFIGNLSWATSEGALQETFAQYGSVVEATIMVDKFTGRSRGFGFVTMSTAEEAEAAAKALDNTDLDGRPVKVNIARPKEDRPAGGGGGYGGGGGGGGGYRGGGGGGGGGGGYRGGGGGGGGGGRGGERRERY